MFFLEDDNFLLEDQIKKLSNLFTNNTFNFFLSAQQVREGHKFYFQHCLIERNTQQITSDFTPFFLEIFKTFCDKNKLIYKKIFRASINLTTHDDDNIFKPEIHCDHDFYHKQFIMYFNDSDGDTIIFDKKGENIIKSITPKKFKAICFESYPHCPLSPSRYRIVLVITFL
jgi:hypothetical protein